MNCFSCTIPIWDIFFSSARVDGSFDFYCHTCYEREVIGENQGMIGDGTTIKTKCECGKEKHGFASHSNWCEKA